MALELYKIVDKAIEIVKEKEEIMLCLPKIVNNKGILESVYEKVKIFAHIDETNNIIDTSQNKGRYIEECTIYLEKNTKIQYLNTMIQRSDNSLWRIIEILESGKSHVKLKAYRQDKNVKI